MFFVNTHVLNLTGTNFGALSQYPKVLYADGYYYKDSFGRANFSYSLTVNGNSLTTPYSADSEIQNIPNLVLWLDTQDTTKVRTQGNVVSGILDKSNNSLFFRASSSYEGDLPAISNWPLTGTFLTNKRCVKMLQNNFFTNSSFYINLSSSFTLYFVWRDRATGISIPFSFRSLLKTDTGILTSDLIAINDYSAVPQITWGNIDSHFGTVVDDVSGLLYKENITRWVYNKDSIINQIVNVTTRQEVITSQRLEINNINIPIVDTIYLTGGNSLSATIIGYPNSNNNNFLFGEMIIFNRILKDEEHNKIMNTLSNKWNLPFFLDNVNLVNEISGGPFSNVTYEDFSLLTSVSEIPIQSCLTELTINLQEFDQSVSKISKIVYSYNNQEKEISSVIDTITTTIDSITITDAGSGYTSIPELSTQNIGVVRNAIILPQLNLSNQSITGVKIIDGGLFTVKPKIGFPGALYKDAIIEPNMVKQGPVLQDNTFSVIITPDKNNFLTNYTVFLSVYRFDSTINKFILSGKIIKCGIKDLHNTTSILDAQLLDNTKELLLITENKNKELVFTNKINVSIPSQVLSGGDVEPLINKDVITTEDEILLIEDLLEQAEREKETFRTPIIPPLPVPKINPIRPE